MDQNAFDALLAEATAQPVQRPASPPGGEPAPAAGGTGIPVAAPVEDAAAGSGYVMPGVPTPGSAPAPSPQPDVVDLPVGPVEAGFAKAAFQTKDFIFGRTQNADKSDLRRYIEDSSEQQAKGSTLYGLTEGVSQFAAGMLGAGKIIGAGKALGMGVTVTSKLGRYLAGTSTAAGVGAVAFDPQAQRISNIVQSFPALSNPVNDYLSYKPGDSDAEGRFKNAIESLGLDVATAGLLKAGLWGYNAIRHRNPEGAAAASAEARALLERNNADVPEPAPSGGTPEAPAGGGAPEGPLRGEVAEVPGAGPDAGAAPGEPRSPAPRDLEAEYGQYIGMEERPHEVVVGAEAPSGGIEVSQAGTPTAEGAQRRTFNPATIPAEQMDQLVDAIRADADALETYGSWNNAVGSGEVAFGKGGNIPWQKMVEGPGGPEVGIQALAQRMSETIGEQLNRTRGGGPEGVLTDAQVGRMLGQRIALWGEDPAALMGMIQAAGANSRSMLVNMEAASLIAQRSMADTHVLAKQLVGGYIHPRFGSMEEAQAALRQMTQVSATAWANFLAMRAGAGRAMRRMREEFRPDMDMLDKMQAMDADQLARLLDSTGGDPRNMAKLMEPSLWKQGMDGLQYLYVNNLLWGPRTHFVNLSTNAYMVVGRPLERIIGGATQLAVGTLKRDEALATSGRRAWVENQRQFQYMMGSIGDSWTAAKEAWAIGDSVMTPHAVEANTAGNSMGAKVAQADFKPVQGFNDILHNAIVAGAKLVGTPTRALGTADELVKQVVYRGHVQAQAFADGIEQGLKGADLEDFIRNSIHEAFDDAGRATNLRSIQEAMTTTFQQDLLPGTIGKTISTATANHPAFRFILPFVKTPTNVIRMGIKMTPGLNMLQKEYRRMLAGPTAEMVEGSPQYLSARAAQQQAIGQMSMGSLFMATAASLSYAGKITGGPPSDPQLKAQLMATGWQPYSFVWAHADGSKTYVPYGRYDPVAMPFGLVADLMDILVHSDKTEDAGVAQQAGEAATAVLLGMVKNLGAKSYLKGLTDVLDAVSQPGDDENGKVGKAVGQMAANMVPFSSALRFANPDNNMHDARGIVDSVKATIPGFSTQVPVKYDALGEPLTVHKGLWVDGKTGIVDVELRRLAEDFDQSLHAPGPNLPGDNVDLREITLASGQNAYDRMQQLSGQLQDKTGRNIGPSLRASLAKVMGTAGYRKAYDDGGTSDKGSKMYALATVVSRYRESAKQIIKSDPNVRRAIGENMEALRKKVAAQRLAEQAQTSQKPAVGPEDVQRLLGAFGAAN